MSNLIIYLDINGIFITIRDNRRDNRCEFLGQYFMQLYDYIFIDILYIREIKQIKQ